MKDTVAPKTKVKTLVKKFNFRSRYLGVGMVVGIISIGTYLVFFSNSTRAATLALTTSATTIQVDVANRYRAILRTDDTTDILLIYDRAENDATPDLIYEQRGPYITEEGTDYGLRDDGNRRTTLLEATATRVRVRVEGCLDTSSGGACLEDGNASAGGDVIDAVWELTFTQDGFYSDVSMDFKDGYNLDTTGGNDEVFPYRSETNESTSNHSETIYYGDGETETQSTGDELVNENTDGYFIYQGTGSYQDIFIAQMNKNGDRQFSNSSNGRAYYNINTGNSDDLTMYDTGNGADQTMVGIGHFQYAVFFMAQTDLDDIDERKGMFNDLSNPDTLKYLVGEKWDTGSVSPGVEFDGTDDRIEVPNSSSLNFNGGDFSLETWIYLDELPSVAGSDSVFLDKSRDSGDATARGWQWRVENADDKFRFRIWDSAGTPAVIDIDSDDAVEKQKWYHVAVVYTDSDDTAKMYVNGVKQVLEDTGVATDYADEMTIGAYNDAGNTHETDGLMDDVRIWNKALSEDEIRANMSRTLTGTEEGLVAYYPMNEDAGTIAYDLTGNGNNGTLTADATWDSGVVPDQYSQGSGAYSATAESNNQLLIDLDAASVEYTLLNGAVTAGDTTITVDATSGFDAAPGIAYILNDKFSYTGTTATTFTGIPASGELAVNGHADNSVVSASNRFNPSFQIRGWSEPNEPDTVTLEGTAQTSGTNFNANVKPVTEAYFAQDIVWYSGLEGEDSDIGDDLSNSGCSFVEGRYGKGVLCDDNNDDIAGVDGIDFDSGAVEFWFQPTWDHDDGVQHYFFREQGGSEDFNLRKLTTDELRFEIDTGSTDYNVDITSGNYSWEAGDWVHIRVDWDQSASAGEQHRIFINGEEPTHSNPASWTFSDIGEMNGDDLRIGNNSESGTVECQCIIDEFYLYDFNGSGDQAAVEKLSVGGDTSDAEEYLADTTNDYTFDFNAITSDNQGEYLFIGSDAQFTGLNIDWATLGVSTDANMNWQYWDGTRWSGLKIDPSHSGVASFVENGHLSWDDPGNWLPYSKWGGTDLYYVRAHLQSGSYSTDPIEDQMLTDILTYQHLSSLSSNDQTFAFNMDTADDEKGDEPKVHWSIDDIGDTVSDRVSVRPLTVVGPTWVVNGAGAQPEEIYLQFDGTDDYIWRSYDPTLDFGSESFTLSGWFRHPEAISGTDTIISNYADAGYRVYMNSSGNICFGVDDDSTWGPDDSACSTTDYSDSGWHHFSAVKSGTTSATLYIDGEQQAQDASIAATGSINTNALLSIGSEVTTPTVGAVVDNTITTSTDEGSGNDVAWQHRVFFDPNNDRWHVVFVDSDSDIHTQSTAYDDGLTWTDGSDIDAGTYDYDDFSCTLDLDGGTTYIHCAYSQGSGDQLFYKRCELTGTGPYISCGTEDTAFDSSLEGGESADDVSQAHIAIDSNDCVLMLVSFRDDSEVTADEYEIVMFKEASTCGDGDYSHETGFPLYSVQTSAGFERKPAVGIESYGDLDAQLYWVDADTSSSTDLETVHFDGDTDSIGTERELNSDVEWGSNNVYYSSVISGDRNITVALDDGTTDLDAYVIESKDGALASQVDTNLDNDATTTLDYSGTTTFILDTNSVGGDDIWFFSSDEGDMSDIYYNVSTDGGDSWGSSGTLWVDTYDIDESKFMDAAYNSENCDVMLSWIGNDSTPWNVNTKIINTGSCNTETNPWDGFIDNIWMYDYARTADQVKTDFNVGPQTGVRF